MDPEKETKEEESQEVKPSIKSLRTYQGDVEEIGDALFKKFRGKLGARLPKFVTERFKGQILCDFYENDFDKVNSLELDEVELIEKAAINRYRGRIFNVEKDK